MVDPVRDLHFTHHLQFEIPQNLRTPSVSEHFVTVHGFLHIEWIHAIRIIRPNPRLPNVGVRFELLVRLATRSIDIPNEMEASFRLSIKSKKHQLLGEPISQVPNREVQGGQYKLFLDDGAIIDAMKQAFNTGQNVTYCATVTLNFSESSFFRQISFQEPPEKDFRFECFDPSSDDSVKVCCRDGFFLIEKAALFRSSTHFRKLLRDQGEPSDKIFQAGSLDAVKTTMTFMMTGSFVQPNDVTPDRILEILRIGRSYGVIDRREFEKAVEQTAVVQIQKETSLDSILRWLLGAATIGNLPQLQNTAVAMILKNHLAELEQRYGLPKKIKERNEMSDIHRRLHEDKGNLIPNPYMRILQLHRYSQSVIAAERIVKD